MQGPPGEHETAGPSAYGSVRAATGAHQPAPLNREARPSASTARQRVALAHEMSAAARGMAFAAPQPPLDQTRTVGTVTLPGAFVGMVLGGASPVDAAIVQLVVLVSLLAVDALAAAVALWLCTARGWGQVRG